MGPVFQRDSETVVLNGHPRLSWTWEHVTDQQFNDEYDFDFDLLDQLKPVVTIALIIQNNLNQFRGFYHCINVNSTWTMFLLLIFGQNKNNTNAVQFS